MQTSARIFLIIAALWTLILAASLAWNVGRSRQQIMDQAYAEARANLNKDITFRRWATRHGGVYVPVTETQKSVPWLSHVPGRDVNTTDGRSLTLLNPASMLRQIMDQYAEDYGIRGRITGLKYLNPANAPDSWEKAQLESFARGEKKEVWEVANVDGKPQLRYLRAMFMEPGCDKCHAILGYKTGDLRGATGLNLPLDGFYQQIESQALTLGGTHGAIWIIGLIGIGWAARATQGREKEARFLAYHDALTALPNRRLAQDRFCQAVAYADRSALKVALLFLDLDNFKTINDSLGHLVGDALVKEVGRRLTECVRDIDTVGRQGGDEFLVVLSGLRNAEALAPVLVKLMNRLVEPMVIEGHELSTSASIGITLYPDDGRDFELLMKKADMAMYRAKDAGRNTYRFFDEQMNVDAVEQLRTRNGLRKALAQHEFVLHYQPQMDITSGALLGAEALIRWNHPELGMVPPGRFISVAEDSGMIVPIGEWVLREACRQAVSWQKDGMRDLTVAVNLSAVQFKRGDIEQSVIRALEESGLNPVLLELELTESILIHDSEKILGTVRRLKQMGVKLSIDDFGTGYSSLSYLKRFQVDKIKIDQSFVRDLVSDSEDAAIVQAIIQMAHSLALTTIAEGVEDETILERLHEFHCDEAQGYYFARPMPSEDFAAFRKRLLTGPGRVVQRGQAK